MESVLKGVLEEELERNLRKQAVFQNELSKYPKGSLCIVDIHSDKYVYRKYRDKNKVISKYIGSIESEDAKKAFEDRVKYIRYKQDLKDLKEEEKRIKKMIKIFRSH